MKIFQLNADEARMRQDGLAALLRDGVEHGASMGFVLPLSEHEVTEYWSAVAADVAADRKCLFAAEAYGLLIGTAQIALESRPNGRHRAEIQKVIVRHASRGAGVGTALMEAVEAEARVRGRSLLFLDTSVGRGGAERFYEQLGYLRAGGIPGYAADPDGRLADNAIFYKRL